FKGQNRNVETIAKADKARGFVGGVNIEHTCQDHWLLRDDADDASIHARKADDDITREMFLHLKEIAVVHDALDDIEHVIGLVGIVGNEVIELGIGAQGRIGGGAARWVFGIVLGQERKECANHVDRFFFAVCRKVGDAAGVLCTIAPPSVSKETSSWVTARTTSG